MESQLTWYGQSAFKIVTPSGNVLLIDPWLTNPVYKRGKEEIAALKRVELILITHGHSDHVGDAVEIAKRTRAKLVATYDLGDAMVKSLGYPAELAETETIGHFGGELTLLNGAVKLVAPRTVVPMHYATFPVLTGTPEAFDRELKKRNVKAELRVISIGETVTLSES